MESSDEEDKTVPEFVTKYYFVDFQGDIAPFSNLPLLKSDDDTDQIPNSSSQAMILRGKTVSGHEKVFEKVIGWRLELPCVIPEFYVISNKDKIWINLLKPKNSYGVVIKSVLVTAHFLHSVKKNLETSEDAMWSYVFKALSFLDVKPCKQDLLDQISLIESTKTRDKDLVNSKFLSAFLLTITGKSGAFDKEQSTARMSEFIADDGDYDDDDDEGDDDDSNGDYNRSDNDGDYDEDDDEDEEEEDSFDHVCAICDEGGEILGCDGRCIRSFHATVDAGGGSCRSLGYTRAQVEAMPRFLCKNCRYEQHQCFICGNLGSSNKSSGAEVFACVSATCGHFYHPKCVSIFIYPVDGNKARELQEKILAGESFVCPAHKCTICKHGEDKKVKELQFALCRRCPKAYHRKCLPRNIVFEADDENEHIRAWDGLLPSRVLIYCMRHSIRPELGTPLRNHIIFPPVDTTMKRPLDSSINKERDLDAKRTKFLPDATGKIGGNVQKPVEKTFVSVQTSNSVVERGGASTLLKNSTMFISGQTYKSSFAVKKDQPNTVESTEYSYKPKVQKTDGQKKNNMIIPKSIMIKASNPLPPVDADMKKRILRLMDTSTSSFDMKEFVKKQRMLSENSYNYKPLDKTMNQGRVELAVNAARTALKRLEEGCSIEDAKDICDTETLKRIVRWKKNLGSYIAPFLNGKRYTSFGRHFTKVEKLKQIVDRLQCYVQDGDVIVDFCCGSNYFSLFMKEKLEEMGKNCSYRNFDLITPKNDFNFEKRDWMNVGLDDLPNGSNMIMGLNPPFANANEFVLQAIKFKPKLIILIVPESTRRLDRLHPSYDLIWEDNQLLAGKSFYLPGSVNVREEQIEQWNQKTPPLYLWSRPDWTSRHIDVALNHGHLHADPRQISGSDDILTADDIHVYGDLLNVENITM